MKLAEFNNIEKNERTRLLMSCCFCSRWASELSAGGPFLSIQDLIEKASLCWSGMSETDILEAFSGHPRIGDVKDLEEKYGSSPMEEQASVRLAKTRTLELLKNKNEEYAEKFGFIFIVFATGKSAEEMLGLLESRLGNSREMELENGAREQSLIFTKRLRQLLEVP